MAKTYFIGHSKADGFHVIFVSYSRFRSIVLTALDSTLCYGHRFAWQYDLCNTLHDWYWTSEQEIATVKVDKETAMKVTRNPESWAWLDEES